MASVNLSRATATDEANLDLLTAYGPFPEPLFAQDVPRASLSPAPGPIG